MPDLLPVSDSSEEGSDSDVSSPLSSIDTDAGLAADSLLRRVEPYDNFVRRTQASDEGPYDYESNGARS